MLLELVASAMFVTALILFFNPPRQEPTVDNPGHDRRQRRQAYHYFGEPQETLEQSGIPPLSRIRFQPRSHLSLHLASIPALCWDEIARESGLQYVFAGDFAGHLGMPNEVLAIHRLEIIIDPSATANNHQILRNILRRHPDKLTITISGDSLIIMEHNNEEGYGIAVQLFVAGCPPCSFELIPPPFSSFYNAGNPRRDILPTYEFLSVPGDYRRLPVLRPHLLLQQRLLRFEETTADPSTRARNGNEIPMMRHFLRRAAEEFRAGQSVSFSSADVQDLPGIFRRWVRYAEAQGSHLTATEVQDAVVVGLLTAEDLRSLGFRNVA